MIKKISEIKNFGIFNNFQWNATEFKKYNFFYGWNYSGKTTLSRVFKCLVDKKAHSDFPNTSFKLVKDDNSIITEQNIGQDYDIRVFNEEFIEENFKWNNENAKIDPVLILGKEAKDLQNELDTFNNQRLETEKKCTDTDKTIKDKNKYITDSLTSKASEIRNLLGITNQRVFDRNKLEEKIDTIKNSYAIKILDDQTKEDNLNLYRSGRKEKVNFEIPKLQLTNFISDIENIIAQKVITQQIIEKFKENPELSEWVRKGIDLHKDESTCQFCGNPLTPVRLAELNNHFSKEFDNLINQIKKQEEDISTHINEIRNLYLPDKARLFEGLQDKYEEKLELLNQEKKNYISTLELLNKKLKEKRDKPFDLLEIKEISNNTKKLNEILKKIETIINEHNSKVDSFEKEKKQAKEKLIDHWTAVFIKEINYFDKKNEVEELTKSIELLKNEANEIENKISDINEKIKEEAIGVKTINEYLEHFFNDDNIKIVPTDDYKYKLYRKDKNRNYKIAKNLSTGERNIISLVYFFTKLEEKGVNLSNLVVFIDDPVSSLDNNHTYKVYGFLYEKLKDCGQLFITTHNFDFFNLLKDFKGYDLKKNGEFYLIKKISKNGSQDKESVIENLPSLLKDFKSEYNYLFSILKNFNDTNDKSNFDLLYLLPNIARRFLEAYLYMRYPNGKKFKDKCITLFENENVSTKQSTLKLLDEYSHEESPEHSLKFPDINEIETSIKFILETIEKKDKEHYEALCNSVTN